MNERALIYFLVFIIWSQLSWRWYTTEIRGFYRSESAISSKQMESEEGGSLQSSAGAESTLFELKQNGAILFFPYKSVSQRLDEKLRKHLSDLTDKAMMSDGLVKVIGHTDSKGSGSYNKRLGQERAEMVAEILRAFGVEEDKLEVISKGEDELLFANGQEGPAAMNRRVEIILLDTDNETNN